MAVSRNDLAIFAARVFVAVDDINKEFRMSVLISDLAATVRGAKKAIATASDAASRLNGSAGRVVQRIAEVEAMVGELNDAEAQLAAALGSSSNGGPPLSDAPAVSPPAPSPHPLTIDASLRQVERENAAASPAPTT